MVVVVVANNTVIVAHTSAHRPGTITANELLKVIAKTDSMDFETAYATSQYLMHHADKAGNGVLDFKEYFTAQEVLLTFDQVCPSYFRLSPLADD